MASMNIPIVVQDPRFEAARSMVVEGAIDERVISTFASLLEECRNTFGTTHVESAPAYYEYGNAILRGKQAEEEAKAKAEAEAKAPSDPSDKRKIAAAAAEHRATEDSKPAAIEPKASDESSDDTQLALEMMESAWSILTEYCEGTETKYRAWAEEQIPRYLTGIGDILATMEKHADSADAYLRALEHRSAALAGHDAKTVAFLQARRRVAELNILIAEQLLACSPTEDVVTSESETKLVSKDERVDYARGYYDKARDELQETVVLMAEMTAKGMDLDGEKENVCFASTLIMAVGEQLAQIEEEGEGDEPTQKKAKTVE